MAVENILFKTRRPLLPQRFGDYRDKIKRIKGIIIFRKI